MHSASVADTTLAQAASSSDQVRGGFAASRPAAANTWLFMYMYPGPQYRFSENGKP